MPGILDASGFNPVDPVQQGILQAAFGALAASGPSRMPVSVGQVLGQAGSAGLQGYDTAQKARMTQLQAEKLATDVAIEKMLAGNADLGATDPDKLEQVGAALAARGHAGGAALISQAEKMRAKKVAAEQLKTMQGDALPQAGSDIVGVSPTEEEALKRVEAASAAGQTATIGQGNREGLFGSLINSPNASIAAEARANQGILNSQTGTAIDPKHWVDLKKDLAAREAMLLARENNLPKSEHVIADKASPTGWAYEDTRSGKRTLGAPPPSQAAGQMTNAIIPPEHKDLHGEDYLSTLPTGMANTVRSVVSGKTSLNDASMRYGNREALKERVLQADPSWQGNRFKNRQEFENPNGKTQLNITAMNTVVAHMGTVNDMIDALKNGNLRQVNGLVNTLRTEAGYSEVNNANTAIQAMGNELMRVFRQVGASEHEIRDWENKFNATKNSPAQLKGALQTGAKLLEGRLDAVNDMWKRTVDPNSDAKILSDKSKAAFSKMGIVKEGVPLTAEGAPAEQPVKRRRYNPTTGGFE